MNDTATQTAPTTLTEAQTEYARMDTLFTDVAKPILDELKAARAAVIAESGVGVFFQDGEGIVYLTAEKKGQWVDFFPYEIQRTRRIGETKGSLSMKAAQEAGFTLPEAK